jgi:choline kinase
MLNIVIPMAGRGSRFAVAGYPDPKPLIPIHGVPMIKIVVDNLTPKCEHRFIFVCQNEHIREYNLVPKLKSYAKNVEVIGIDGITEGQVCTTLAAKKFFDNDAPLMSANSDQFIDIDINEYLDTIANFQLDGMVITMKVSNSNNTKQVWSYVKTDDSGIAVQTSKGIVISENAVVGIMNFSRGSDLVRSAEQMIRDNVRVNNEFYTCQCYNYLIREGKRFGIYTINGEFEPGGFFGLGVPWDTHRFLCHSVSERIRNDYIVAPRVLEKAG